MMKLRSLLLAAILALPITAGADDEPTFIYGGELMSAQERERFRHELKQRGDAAAQAEYREQHRERIRKRAHQRGVELDETSGVIRRRDRDQDRHRGQQ